MKSRPNFIAILLGTSLLLTLSACDFDKEIDIVLPEQANELFLEFYLEDNANPRGLVSYTASYFDSLNYNLPPKLKADLIANGDTIRLFAGLFPDIKNSKFYNILGTSQLNFQDNVTYRLQVKDDSGRLATAQATALPKIEVDSISTTLRVVDTSYSITIWIKDDAAATNFYRVVVNKDSSNGGASLEQLLQDNARSGTTFPITSGYDYKAGDSAIVRLYNIEKTYFDFLESARDAERSNGNPFAQPASLKSNVKGGKGIFTILRPTTRSFVVGR